MQSFSEWRWLQILLDKKFFHLYQKNDKESQNYTKSLLKVLPYYGVNIILSHGQFNNLLNVDSLPSKKYLHKLHSSHDLDVFSMNTAINSDINPDSHLTNHKIRTNYYSPHSFNNLKQSMLISEIESSFSILYTITFAVYDEI